MELSPNQAMSTQCSEGPHAGTPIEVGVVGGRAWFVATIESVLTETGRFKLAQVGDNAATVLEKLTPNKTAIIILSANGSCSEMIRSVHWVRKRNPDLRVVVHLSSLKPGLVRDIIQAGAWGCFCHDDSPEVMINVLSSVASDRVSFPYIDLATLSNDPFEQLSRRELDVLQALSKGWSNAQLSARLGISENTVKYHLKLIYGKLDVPNRATAISHFMQHESR